MIPSRVRLPRAACFPVSGSSAPMTGGSPPGPVWAAAVEAHTRAIETRNSADKVFFMGSCVPSQGSIDPS